MPDSLICIIYVLEKELNGTLQRLLWSLLINKSQYALFHWQKYQYFHVSHVNQVHVNI